MAVLLGLRHDIKPADSGETEAPAKSQALLHRIFSFRWNYPGVGPETAILVGRLAHTTTYLLISAFLNFMLTHIDFNTGKYQFDLQVWSLFSYEKVSQTIVMAAIIVFFEPLKTDGHTKTVKLEPEECHNHFHKCCSMTHNSECQKGAVIKGKSTKVRRNVTKRIMRQEAKRVVDMLAFNRNETLSAHGREEAIRVLVAFMPKERDLTKFPQITATSGMALKTQLDSFVQQCWLYTSRYPNTKEEQFLAMLMSCMTGNVKLLQIINSPTNDPEMDHLPVPNYYRRRCVYYRTQFEARKKFEAEQETETLSLADQLAVKYYHVYQPTDDQVGEIATCKRIIADPNAVNQDVQFFQSVLTETENAIKAAEIEHNNRTPEEKYDWISESNDPKIKAIADKIERMLERDHKRNRHQPIRIQLEKEPSKEAEPQFLAIEDLKALNWLCKYVLNRAGAVTFQTVDDFRSRVMFPDETPLQAKARVINECELCATGSLPGFNKEVEMYLLVSDFEKVGGPFFPSCMHAHLTTTVTFATSMLNIKPNDYAALTNLYFKYADEYWTQQCTKPGTTLNKLYLKEMNSRYALQKQFDQEIRGENTYASRGSGRSDGKNTKPDNKGDGKARDKWCDFIKHAITTLKIVNTLIGSKRKLLIRLGLTQLTCQSALTRSTWE